MLLINFEDAIYVHSDVDPRKSAEIVAAGGYGNSGQYCSSVERVYVHKDVKEEFLIHLKELVEAFPVGDPYEEDTHIAPLTRGKVHLDVILNS